MTRAFSHKLWIAAGVVLTLCVSFCAYVHAEKRIDVANDLRYRSFQQADQLRHSSDDLTRMVRTYVVTGDGRYKQAYGDILDIREGRKQLPQGRGDIYWDLALVADGAPLLAAGQGTPLLELVRNSGVSAEELAKLAEAKANSDGLTVREFEAMRLVEIGGDHAEANRAQAVAMLHDAAYHQAKAAIMGPINDFYLLMDRRTLAAVQDAERVAMLFRALFVACTGGAIWLLWRAHRELRATLGGSADEVHDRITRIGRGDLSALPVSSPPPPGSVLGNLADMRTKLGAIEAARQQAADELNSKNDALARSNAELEAFAYVASHDLREPLRNVTAFTTMLKRRLEGRLHDDEPELLKIVTDAAMRMDSLVRDLLEVSRVGRSEQEFRPVAMADVIAVALDNLRSQIAAVGATVEVAADLPVVSGNRDELYRVFQNIIGNSLKYRQNAAPIIRIACTADDNADWRFEIRDNGIGIEGGQGYEERIFGLFQRLHQRDDHGGGTGIGLPICRKIINRHGGQIWAESAGLGHGTALVFTLPKG